MKTTLILAAAATLGLAASANAATISYTALNDGNGNGANATVGTQPIGIAGGLDMSSTFDAFVEPTVANGTNAALFTTTNASGTSLTIQEGTFDSFSLGGPAATLAAIDFSGSDLDYEASAANGGNGTSQNKAASAAWGVDTDTVVSSSSNTVLSFSLDNNTSGTFSTLILDLEGGAPGAASAFVAVYDAFGALSASQTLNFPGAEFGDNGEYLFSFEGLGANSTIAFFSGDDELNGNGYRERIATADFATYAPVQINVAAVPLPMSGLLLGAGLLGFAGLRRRK